MKKRFYLFAALIGITLPMMAAIELSKSNPTYEQNFDGTATAEVLALTDQAITDQGDSKRSVSLAVALPEGWKVRTSENGTSNIGVYSTGATTTTYVGGTSLQANSKRGTWNLGKSQNSDRAIGGITSASTTGGAAVKCVNVLCKITNTEAEAITSLDLSYAIEQYRQGKKNYKMTLYTSTTGASGSWTAVDDAFSLVFDNTVSTATGAADASLPISTKSVEAKKLAVNIAAGASLYLAWNLAAADGNEDGGSAALALDDVTITANYGEANPDPEPEPEPTWGQSKFCNASDAQYEDNNTKVALKWQTAYNGDVVIDILNGDNTFGAVYRNGGFEGGMAGFKVLSGEDFTTETAASEYFTRKGGEAGTTTFRLVKKDAVTLPYPCKIKFTTNALAWSAKSEVSGELKGCYTFPTIEYTYYTHCQDLDTPTGIAISNTGRISFNEVSGADSYVVFVYNETGTLIHTQNVVNNEILDMVIMSTGTYTVKLIALKGEFASNKSKAYEWTVEAGKVYAKSKYCDWVWNTTANGGYPIYITWVTEPNGDMKVTINPVEDVDKAPEAGNTRFRESMLSRVTVGGQPASNYFDGSYSGNVMTFTLKDPANRPANGTIVHHDGALCYRNDIDGKTNAWPTFTADYVYGTKCTSADAVAPVITTFEKVSVGVDAINFHVEASDVDDEGTPQTITYSLAGTNGFVTTAVTPDGDGNFVVEGLKKNCDYSFTLTVTDPASNTAVSDPVVVRMQFDAEDNLALNKPAECGCSESASRGADKANDGDPDSSWGTYGCTDKAVANVWTVDLGTIFDVDRIHIICDGTQGATPKSIIYASWDKTNWVAIIPEQAMGNSGDYTFTSLNAPARYLKLQSAGTGMQAVKEFEVKGLGYATTDAVAPQVTVSEVSKTENTATLKIVASDVDDASVAHPVKSITISGDNGFTTIENAVLDAEGNITLNGLKDNATYNFHVTVTDRVGLTAEQDIEVRVAFNTTTNLALASNGATAEAGSWEGAPDGTAHNPSKAIDGKAAAEGVNNTYWGTWGCGNYENSNTFTLTLAASYNINSIVIKTAGFDGITEHNITLSYSADKISWTPFVSNYTLVANETNSIPVVISAKYIRLTSSTNHMITIKEFEVYGSSYDDGDDVAPEITSATLVSTGEESAVVSVVATDNVGVFGLQFVDEANSFNVEFDYIHGENVTLVGLAPGTTYNFKVYALDRAGNVSEPKALEITTTNNPNVPHTAAPAPTITETRVISIFSNTYSPAIKEMNQWRAYGGDVEYSAKVIAGNDYAYYVGHNTGEFALGAVWKAKDGFTDGVHTGVNVASRAYVHVDVWALADGTINVCLNDAVVGSATLVGGQWNSINLPISAINLSIRQNLEWMKFTNIQGKTLAIDNIYFYGVAINQDADNSATLATFNNQAECAVLNRSFKADGYYYTLCLPFDMSADQIAAAFGDCEISEMISSELRETLIHVNFDYTDHIVAGQPYIFLPKEDIKAPLAIDGVTIKNVASTTNHTGYIDFIGFLNPTVFEVNESQLFLGSSDILHPMAADQQKTPGLRAYFQLNADAPQGARAKVVLGPQVTTDIENQNGETMHGEPQKLFIDGQLYIIRAEKMYNVQGQIVK